LKSLFLLTIFFLSGISGLIYEVVWTRKLTLLFGSTTVAISISLAVFMGGLALGAFIWGRRADRMRRPLLVYGLLELGIGLYGALSYRILAAIEPFFFQLQKFWSLTGAFYHLPQIILISLVLLPPTILMGGTLPVLLRAYHEPSVGLGARVGRLYAANTAGAVFGALFSGFFLLPDFGLKYSLFAAAAINILLSLGAIVVSKSWAPLTPLPNANHETKTIPASYQKEGPFFPFPFIAFVVFLSGFCSLFYEVVWSRALSLILGNSTRAFSLMLSSFLLGLALGIILAAFMVRKNWVALKHLAIVQGIIGICVFWVGYIIQQLPDWTLSLFQNYKGSPGMLLFSQGLLAASVMLLPALFMGIIFPLSIALTRRQNGYESDMVGKLYALNTIGAIGGSLLASLFFIPALGMKGCLLLGTWINLLFAAGIFLMIPGQPCLIRLGRSIVPPALALLLTWASPSWDTAAMTRGLYFYAPTILDLGIEKYLAEEKAVRIIYYKEGRGGTVAVKEAKNQRFLSIDGRGEGSYRATAQVLLGHLPFMLNRTFKDVGIIGFGTGNTTGTVTLYPVQRVDVFELEAEVIQTSSFFETVNHKPLADPRVRILTSDARTALFLSPRRSYDLLISQPSNPWVSGSSKLFTFDFYHLAASRLRPNGVFTQWVQLYNMDFTSVGSMLNTFKTTFPNTLVLEVGSRSGEIILLGSREELNISWKAMLEIFADPRRAEELSRVKTPNPGTLLARLILGPEELISFNKFPLNTDDNGLLEFSTINSLYRKTTEENLTQLRKRAVNPWKYLNEPPEGEERQKVLIDMARASLRDLDVQRGLKFAQEAYQLRENADSLLTLGDLLYANKKREEGISAWRRGLNYSPNHSAILSRLLRHFGEIDKSNRPPEYDTWVTRFKNVR
jgi:spermidine synthase